MGKKYKGLFWRQFLFTWTAVFVLIVSAGADVKTISAPSPWNSVRPKRGVTAFIILHTTEGPFKGSLDKIRRNGEAHYLIDERGSIYRIIDRDRIATHCGRSMWNGVHDLDQYSIGIEMVGNYNRKLTSGQLLALSSLVAELKGRYHIPDSKILSHSMVAYGAPNRWHKRSHRGRKRCGALFAQTDIRRQLGIGAAPEVDPDVKSGRLVNADAWLADFLYKRRGTIALKGDSPQGGGQAETGSNVIGPGRSAWDIARDAYNSPDTTYVFPDGTKKRGNEITKWNQMPSGTKVLPGETVDGNEKDSLRKAGRGGEPASEIAGDSSADESTIYFLPDGRIRTGREMTRQELSLVPEGTSVLVGYVSGGTISSRNSAFEVCGSRWNLPSTVYRLPDGSFQWGDDINERKIPRGSRIYFCK